MATVKLFGVFRDLAGWSESVIDVPTLGGLKAKLVEDHPGLAERLDHPTTLVIKNALMLHRSERGDDLPLEVSDEIAFGPPVSGG
ncbi:MoaD/ThiS family protein [Brevundimonas goettingensis]|uniref:MoaD/ThiS family protein n=1 Tax=Brevundimonas goettingensis TaxID=2774190 RepID=A0A975GY04_9CAUL|nr:MoaD/ThiS family protein [Brevundimonas goettingensis]QTC91090.1 MoaD/ThiS family protein [Brevundimonas goettingensis]